MIERKRKERKKRRKKKKKYKFNSEGDWGGDEDEDEDEDRKILRWCYIMFLKKKMRWNEMKIIKNQPIKKKNPNFFLFK